MPENQRFLEALKLSFRKCLSTSVRSNEKLKVLHSFIAKDLEASLADSAFQIFCIFDKIPYFDNSGVIKKWEKISRHNLDKYIKLSQDDIDCFYHTPDKTLLCIVHLSPDAESKEIKNKRDYENYYLKNDFSLTYSAEPFDFGKSVIYNDYKKYIEKITHRIKSI